MPLRPLSAKLLLLTLVAGFGFSVFTLLSLSETVPPRDDFALKDLSPPQANGCRALVDNYCVQLHSQEARGNLRLTHPDLSEALTTLGSTRNNFDSALFAYHKARQQQKNKLPARLLTALERRSFYEDLTLLLRRPPRDKMRFEDRIYYSDLENRVFYKWNQSIEEVVWSRVSSKFPHSYRLTDSNMPREVEVEYSRVYYSLWSEISRALWDRTPRWVRIQKMFDELKASFLTVIERMNVSQEIKLAWSEKVRKVQLRIPGFNPSIANRDCITTTRNAYYYPYLNTITVCAGYINSGEQLQTLAHELSHSLDYTSLLIDEIQKSSLQMSFRDLRRAHCKNKDFTCDHWQSFQDQFNDNLEKLKSYRPELYSFHKCLKKDANTRPLDPLALERISTRITDESFSSLVKSSALFRITKKEMPLRDGQTVPNKSYLNPCDYYTWDMEQFALDGELANLLLFTSIYQCTEGDELQKIRQSVHGAKKYSQKIMEVLLQLEGEFSAREEMQNERISSSPVERFADRVGSEIVAEYLKRQQTFAQKRDPRVLFLASSYWLCDRPSLLSKYMEEYQGLQDILMDTSLHQDNPNRIKDWLSTGVREVLHCEADFEHQECSLAD